MRKQPSKLVKAFKILRDKGWFCEFKLACCQNCAWGEIPDNHQRGLHKGEEVDLEKVLFNHAQDWGNYVKSGATYLAHSGNVEHVKEAVKVIEECGCTVHWSGNPDSRLYVDTHKEDSVEDFC